MPKYPQRIAGGADPGAVFEHRSDLYSIRHDGRDRNGGAVAVMDDDAHARFAVYEGEPGPDAPPTDVGPVYSLGRDGPLAVPTGRVLVRMTAPVTPAERRAEFAKAGFEIERTLSYAPDAAWLRPSRGGVARGLLGLAALQQIAGVAHVEPQMLLARALKGRRPATTR